MPNHSPGPWRKGGHWIIRDAGAAGLPVCEVWPRGVGDEKAYANENLIAAAPDLLAVVVLLRCEHARVNPHHEHLCNLCQLADAAIAKAEGNA